MGSLAGKVDFLTRLDQANHVFIKILIPILFVSFQAWGQMSPKVDEDSDRIGINLGVASGMTITKFEGEPLGIPESEMTPPTMTLKFEYRPDYSSRFQPDARLAFSLLRGSGQHFFGEIGGWFDFPKFHLFFGAEVLTTLRGGNYDETIMDNWGMGWYVKGALPLGIFYPALEFRYRKIMEAEVANQEGLTTYVRHDRDLILRPSLSVDLSILKLWGAYTYYQPGNTAVASKDFAIGIEESSFSIISVGAGLEIVGTEIWVKAHRIEGVQDELAHFYQTPIIYPDFLIAKESAFLEVLWRF